MHRHFLTMSPPPPFFFSCVFYSCTRLLDIWRKVRLLHFVYEIIPLRSLFHCNSWLLWVTFFIYLWNTLNVSRLFFMLRRFPIESKGRRKKLNEVWAFSSKCVYLIVFLGCLCTVVSLHYWKSHWDTVYSPPFLFWKRALFIMYSGSPGYFSILPIWAMYQYFSSNCLSTSAVSSFLFF